MKRLLLLVALFATFVNALAEPVGRADALNTAQAFLSAKGKSIQPSAQPFKAPRRGARVTDDKAYYYIFNVGQEDGYVIVSGDDRTEQVLGYVDNGHYDADNLPINMKGMLQYYSDAIQYLDDHKVQVEPRRAQANRVRSTKHSVPILMASRWNQGFPYNKHCPVYYKGDGTTGQAVTGCTATAVAQVINFYKHPDKLKAAIPQHSNTYTLDNGTTKTVTLKSVPRGTVIDWENMCEVYTGNETDAQNDAVGKLMLYVGMCVKMGYGASSGAVHGSNIPELLYKYFGFDDGAYCADRYKYSAQEWDDLLYSELSTGHPISYQGFSSGGGHAFVIDGYDGEGLYHVNWGWGGGSDGWFVINILNPGDNSGIGASGSSDGYNMSNNAIIGVRLPDSERAESTTCATMNDVQISGSTIKLNFINWTGATNSFDCGIVERLEDGTIKLVSNKVSITSLNANYYQTHSFDMNNRLSEGVHILSPANKLSSNKTYRPLYDMTRNYIEATVMDGKTSLRFVQPEPKLEVESIEFPGTRIAGKEQEVRVTFRNMGDEFFDHLYLVTKKVGDVAGGTSSTESAVLVRSKEKSVVSYFFKPESTGTYDIWISSDKNHSNVYGHATMEAITEAQAVKPKLAVNAMTISNTSNGVVYGNFLKGTISVKNNGTEPFDGRIKLQSWSQNPGENMAWSSKSTSVAVHVEPLKIASVAFEFTEMRTDCKYWISVNDVTTGTQLDKGGVWDHGWDMHPGTTGWKNDGSIAVQASSTNTTPSTWCALYIEGVKTSKQRASKNPNMIYAYGEGITPSTSLNGLNVVVGDQAEAINLVSDTAYIVPTQFTAATASFRYDCKADAVGRWQTFTMPFTPDSMMVDGVTYPLNEEGTPFCIYEYAEDNDNGLPIFLPATELRRNAPYLIAFNEDMAGRSVQFVAENALFIKEGDDRKVVSGEHFRMYGTSYAPKLSNVYMLNAEGTAFEWKSTATTLSPMASYFATSLAETVRPASIPLGPVPHLTAIEEVPATLMRPSEGNVFTLDGRQVAKGSVLSRGIYVVEGKKYLVK